MADYEVLDVRLHGKSVGTLTRLGRDRIVFAFDPGYIDDPARATLSLSFQDPFGHLVTDIPPTRTSAPPFFSNLLPEGPLREYLALAAGIDPRREFPLLAALGQDLPGAVTVVPLEAGPDPISRSGLPPGRRPAGHAAGAGTRPRAAGQSRSRGTPDSVRAPLAAPSPPFRFSLPGVQLKLSATMAAKGRLAIPAQGVGGSWIVKLPSAAFPGLPEQEHAMMTLAARVGIDVPETRLVPVDSISNLPRGMGVTSGKMALAVRRFDRAHDGAPVHVEAFAQVLGARPEEKYAGAGYGDIAEVVGRAVGDDAVWELIRRLVFCALIGNGDAHLKNWALIYPDGRTPALAPAYDLVSTIAFLDDDRMALEWMSGVRGFADLSEGVLRQLAASARVAQVPVVTAARRTVERFMEVWGEAKEELGVPEGVVKAIDAHLAGVPLVMGVSGRRR